MFFKGPSSAITSASTNSDDGSPVKMEVPSPSGSPGSKQTQDISNFLDEDKLKAAKDALNDDKEIEEDGEEDEGDASGDPDILYAGRYSEDSSDDESQKRLKEETEDQGFEGDEGFSKDEPMIDIKVDMERSVRTGGEDEDEEDEEDDDDMEV